MVSCINIFTTPQAHISKKMNGGVELRSLQKEVAYTSQHSFVLPSVLIFLFFICIQIPAVGSSIPQDGFVAHVVDEPMCNSPYLQPASDDPHVVMPADISSNQYTCRPAANANNHTTKTTDIFIIPKTHVPVQHTHKGENYSHSKGDNSNQNRFIVIEYKMYFAPMLKKKKRKQRQIKSQQTGTRKKRIVKEQKQSNNEKYERTSNNSPPYMEEAQPFYSSTSTCRGGGRSKKFLPHENMVASSQKFVNTSKTQGQKTLPKDDRLPTTPVNGTHSEHEKEVNAASSGYVSGKDQQKQPACITTNYEETTVTTSDGYSLLQSRAPCTEESSRLPEVKDCVLDSTNTVPSEIVLERHRESSPVAIDYNLPTIWPVPVEVVDKNVSDEPENRKPQANKDDDVKYENESFLDTGKDESGWTHKEDSETVDMKMKPVTQPFNEVGPSPPHELCEYDTYTYS